MEFPSLVEIQATFVDNGPKAEQQQLCKQALET
jgi:hypothetical protein